MSSRADNSASELCLSQIPNDCPLSNQLHDSSFREQRIIDHLPLVRVIALRVHSILPGHVDSDDVIHAGVMGLIDAASKFNSAKEVAFYGYARHCIRGSILDRVRREDWAPRGIRKRHKQLKALNLEFSATLNRSPTDQEMADRMGVNVERWHKMEFELRMVGLLSASSRMPEEEENQTRRNFQLLQRPALTIWRAKAADHRASGAIGTLPRTRSKDDRPKK